MVIEWIFFVKLLLVGHLEKYKEYDKLFQVGAPVIRFDQNGEAITERELVEAMTFINNPEEFVQGSLYYEDLNKHPPIDINLFNSSGVVEHSIL